MAYYRRRPTPWIEANQYLEGQPIPHGVNFKTLEDGARIAYVTTIQGREVPVSHGEWIVTERGGGGHYPIAAGEFERLYEYASEE